jgi:hypothetical protein
MVLELLDKEPELIYDDEFYDDLTRTFAMKIALEQEMSDKLVYGASLGAQYKQAEPFERAAIDHFKVDGEPGFKIPFYGRVKFIFTMNHALATDLDVSEAKKAKKSMKMLNELEDRYAIFSRLTYQDQYMAKNEYWGWIADLVLNHNILPNATQDDKEEMLEFLHEHWENLKDKSVRMVKQKLWRIWKNPNIALGTITEVVGNNLFVKQLNFLSGVGLYLPLLNYIFYSSTPT